MENRQEKKVTDSALADNKTVGCSSVENRGMEMPNQLSKKQKRARSLLHQKTESLIYLANVRSQVSNRTTLTKLGKASQRLDFGAQRGQASLIANFKNL